MSELVLNDGIHTHDEKKITSSKKRKSGAFYDTDVIFTNQLGEVLFKKSNIILVGGRRFTLEKLFNVNPTSTQSITLNSIFKVNESEPALTGDGPRREKVVCLFGVGRGGSNLTFGSVKNPNAREYNLYDMVPMRYVDVSDDLTAEEKAKYYLRVVEGDKVAYYLKKFEIEPHIVMKVGDQDYIPDLADNTPVDETAGAIERQDVDCYIELQLKINADDVREFYRATEGLSQARVNELSLYTGYQPSHAADVWVDFLGIEAFSKLTFNNEPLDDETKELNIIYRIYI
jgi:hypothetical protein